MRLEDKLHSPNKETKMHQHRPLKKAQREIPYRGPVAKGSAQNPMAHGNICVIDVCSCGASRRTNVNGPHVERGPWISSGVVTWQSPGGAKIDICQTCELGMTEWPRDQSGQEYCSVSQGLHPGACQLCSSDKISLELDEDGSPRFFFAGKQMETSEGIRALMAERNLTARELADIVGSSPRSIADWRSGENVPMKPFLLLLKAWLEK